MSLPIISPSNKKFAVVIGINYNGTSSQLNGCINDAIHIKQFLIEKCNYLSENILFLADDGTSTIPTRQNIINAFNTLIQKASVENFNELWLSYSGHGSYTVDLNNEEADRRDELICPVDYSQAGMLTDDFIYSNLVAKLPASAILFALLDSCNSGTVFDLPYIYINSIAKNNNNIPVAKVITISGSRDDQLSADAYINGKYQGAMTWSFLNALAKANYNIKILDLLKNMRVLMANTYTQIPLLAVTTEDQYDRVFISGPITPVDPPPPTLKSVTFTLTTDYWYKESSWNVLSLIDNKYLFATDNKFVSIRQTVEIVVKTLPIGDYKLIIKDTYGDGGVTFRVTQGLVILTNGVMTTGKIGEFTFKVI